MAPIPNEIVHSAWSHHYLDRLFESSHLVACSQNSLKRLDLAVDADHDLASSSLCKSKFEFVALMSVSMQAFAMNFLWGMAC
jgi:hypothetical protein